MRDERSVWMSSEQGRRFGFLPCREGRGGSEDTREYNKERPLFSPPLLCFCRSPVCPSARMCVWAQPSFSTPDAHLLINLCSISTLATRHQSVGSTCIVQHVLQPFPRIVNSIHSSWHHLESGVKKTIYLKTLKLLDSMHNFSFHFRKR